MRVKAVRSSARRWRQLGQVLESLESLTEACSRLDAYTEKGYGAGEPRFAHELMLERFDRNMRYLEVSIERERDRLTVERLRVDLAIKQRRDALLPEVRFADVIRVTEPWRIPEIDAFWLDIGRPA